MDNVTISNPEMICEGPQGIRYNSEMGWVCPKCGAALAPSVKVCPNCTPGKANEIRYDMDKPNVSCTRDFENGEMMILS